MASSKRKFNPGDRITLIDRPDAIHVLPDGVLEFAYHKRTPYFVPAGKEITVRFADEDKSLTGTARQA